MLAETFGTTVPSAKAKKRPDEKDMLRLLGGPDWAGELGYFQFRNGQLPAGLQPGDLIETCPPEAVQTPPPVCVTRRVVM